MQCSVANKGTGNNWLLQMNYLRLLSGIISSYVWMKSLSTILQIEKQKDNHIK